MLRISLYFADRNAATHTILLVDKTHKLFFCVIPKSGCTSTMGLLAETAPVRRHEHTSNPMMVHKPDYMKSLGLGYVRKTKGKGTWRRCTSEEERVMSHLKPHPSRFYVLYTSIKYL